MRDPKTADTPKLTPEHVAVVRRIKRMSQAELGFTVRRSQPFVSDFERGLVTLSPREEKIIARVLGIALLAGGQS